MPNLFRPLVAGVLGVLLLSGCAQRPLSKAPTADSSDATTLVHPGITGISACDDYLSSYVACHRTAKLYPEDQLPARYEAMRSSLQRDSQNPDIRPQLAARCSSLSNQLRQALHGKSCVEQAPPTTKPH